MNEVYAIVKDSISMKKLYGEVQLDPHLFVALDLSIGDHLEISNVANGRVSVGKLTESDLLNVGKGFIFMNWFLRRNLLIGIGEQVSIRKIVPKIAQKIEFMGANKPLRLKNAQSLSKKLFPYVFCVGDVFSFDLNGKLISLAVKGFSPEGSAIRINEETEIVCNK